MSRLFRVFTVVAVIAVTSGAGCDRASQDSGRLHLEQIGMHLETGDASLCGTSSDDDEVLQYLICDDSVPPEQDKLWVSVVRTSDRAPTLPFALDTGDPEAVAAAVADSIGARPQDTRVQHASAETIGGRRAIWVEIGLADRVEEILFIEVSSDEFVSVHRTTPAGTTHTNTFEEHIRSIEFD